MSKVYVFLIGLFVFAGAQAEIPAAIVGTAEDVVCGEMDHSYVGDVCVVFATDEATGAKYGLVYDFDYWFENFVPDDSGENDVVGDRFSAGTCQYLDNANKIAVLKDFDSEYFYLDCYYGDFSWL